MKKTRVFLNPNELRLVIDSLNAMRNRLIAKERYTDTLDDVLFKAMTAPTKKIKIA